MKVLSTVFMVMIFMFGSLACARAEDSLLVGKKAPDFTLERVSGQSASLGEVIKGKKTILFFFATWCPHCRAQLKEISARKAEFDKAGILVVLVDIGEPKDKVLEFLKAHGLDNDAFLDIESLVSEAYQVLGVPTLVFIGIDGKVRFVEYGLPDNYQQILI